MQHNNTDILKCSIYVFSTKFYATVMYVKHLDFWKINSANHAFLIQFKDSKYLLFYNSIQASPSPIPRTNVSKQIHTKYMRPNKESPNRIKDLDTYQQKNSDPHFRVLLNIFTLSRITPLKVYEQLLIGLGLIPLEDQNLWH